jgi:hypothetical protein
MASREESRMWRMEDCFYVLFVLRALRRSMSRDEADKVKILPPNFGKLYRCARSLDF